jgi:putative component of membrane protein insertase Oxa1/YidC/SpoIIIJ protein YidD
MKIFRSINRLVKQLAIATLHTMRLQLGFWGAPVCLYTETCTPYSARQLREHALPVALIKIAWRLLSCNPITGIIRCFRNR